MALLSCTVPRLSLETNLTEFELGLVVVLWLRSVLKIALMWFVIYLHTFYHWHLSKEEPFIDFWTEIEENRFLRGKNYLFSCGVVDTSVVFCNFSSKKRTDQNVSIGWGGKVEFAANKLAFTITAKLVCLFVFTSWWASNGHFIVLISFWLDFLHFWLTTVAVLLHNDCWRFILCCFRAASNTKVQFHASESGKIFFLFEFVSQNGDIHPWMKRQYKRLQDRLTCCKTLQQQVKW